MLLGLVCLLSNLALASDFHSPRTAALAGAGHAGPVLNDSIYLNPSFASFLPSYSLSANYAPVADPGPHPHFNASILDGRSELFQAGVGITRREHRTFLNVGASKSFIQRLGVGLGAKFLFPQGGSTERDLTAGITFLASPWLQASLVADNLIEAESGIRHGLYRELILGTKFNIQKILMVYVDPHWAPTLGKKEAYGYEAGLEFALLYDIFLRFGKSSRSSIPFLNQRAGGWGFGLGWMAPRLSLDYGFTRILAGASGSAHVFGMSVYF